MIWIFVLIKFLIIVDYCSSNCIYHLKYKGKRDVFINCTHEVIKLNSSIHKVQWAIYDDIIEDKYPYKYFDNGSLLIKDLEKRANHYICNVTDKYTNKTVYYCGTAVTIMSPVFMINTPKNETVNNNTLYIIRCNAGGGDYSILDLKYFINDNRVFVNKPFRIINDTKIECLATSGTDSLSVIAYLIVRRKGTEEDKFLHLECKHVTSEVCRGYLFDKSSRLSNTHNSSHTIVEELLRELFSTLDNNISPEYNEENCVDRFKRLMCSTFYPRCNKNNNGSFVKLLNCRESCESVFYVICRTALPEIFKQVSSLSQQYTSSYLNKNPHSQNYVAKFINDLTKSIMTCDQLPWRMSANFHDRCALINLDIHSLKFYKEQPKSNCYNNIGRNYVGHNDITNSNITCLKWKEIPQLYISFYQQTLQNQTNYCRNPGGIYHSPVCLTYLKKPHLLNIQNIKLVHCLNLHLCPDNSDQNFDLTQGKFNYLIFIGIIVVILLVIVISILVRCFAKKQYISRKKHETIENVPLNDDEINLYQNKVYKHTLNGGFTCPIYNAAHFEKVQTLANGEYGEIVLVQAVIENFSSIALDESYSSNYEKSYKINKRQRSPKSISESENRIIDDFILSVDKTFNEKPCWPFDKFSQSGCCPFAVIKYLTNADSDLKEGRFNKETKILSQLNHPHILRFYGVCLHISDKVICRIVEYLPNGDIKSILTGRRREPPKVANHENNNKIKNGYQSVNALKKSRTFKGDFINSTEETKFFKRKNAPSQSREIERPLPAEHIDLNIKQLIKWGVEVCDAVVYLHTKHLIHRDIATRNCLVGMNLEAKLADFSFVQKFSYGMDLIGNPNEYIPIRWLPKETLENLIYNTDTDVWMFGVFLWELMSLGKDPYDQLDLHGVYDAIMADTKLTIPQNCPNNVYSQMELCFKSARERPCLETVKKDLIKILNEL